ncbi:Thiosulfate-binding protein [Gloeomargarita lithophora Alchichica-D10]|uniref:Thiosulfate-binding protein n=1 Tax=Gloeomargarita lithophora Alchichica-D10 TaxID=1188229 RepID=A0A1J0AEA5_9CYAN|nr:hypothetical protein [Gloeomargarita lithophora]APB34248.1 Thiosulfate-binding protein [Gloeomargarita lithophora Alchichica-D10]
MWAAGVAQVSGGGVIRRRWVIGLDQRESRPAGKNGRTKPDFLCGDQGAAHDRIIPAFITKWRKETGETGRFRTSYGGSGTQARAVIDGLQADVVHLALGLDVDRYVDRRGTRKVAAAFVQYLFTEQAQREFARTGFQPVNRVVAQEFRSKYPPVGKLYTVQALGGWDKVQQQFFADGAMFDRIQANLR